MTWGRVVVIVAGCGDDGAEFWACMLVARMTGLGVLQKERKNRAWNCVGRSKKWLVSTRLVSISCV